MAYNTGNPLGSKDPRDLYDNAEHFDKYSVGPDPMYPNRFGVMKLSIEGQQQAFQAAQEGRDQQFQAALLATGFIDIGNYAAGLTITLRNQVFARDGVYYSANAELVLPYTLTGNWATEESNFILRADAPLRSDLASALGATMVGRGASTVALDLTSAENRLTALENAEVDVLVLAYAADASEEAVKFSEGYQFVLRTDLLVPTPPPAPVYTLDASFIPSSLTLAKAIAGSSSTGGYGEAAFSFTAGVSGVLGRLDVFLYWASGTGDMLMEVRNDTAGLPGTTVYAAQVIPGFTAPATAAAALTAPKTIDLDGVNQVSGTKYWVTFKPTVAGATAFYGLAASAEGTANVVSRAATGGAWVAQAGYHAPFRTYTRVTPA